MSDDLLPLPAFSHFAVLESVVRLLAGVSHSRTARTAGCIARNGCSLHERAEQTPAARPTEEDWERAVKPIQRALAGGGVDKVRFTAEVRSTGRTTGWSGLALPGGGGGRRAPSRGAAAGRRRPSRSQALLERTLRERFPGAADATEEEIAAAEARPGVTLPDELKVLYRVTQA